MPAARYRQVRALGRGLAILRALNKLGEASSASIAEITHIPRPTVHRLFETLRTEGYVTRSSLRDTYKLTMRVSELSAGYEDENWISEVASPILASLCDEVVWPTDIATFDGNAMVIRATTHRRSPLSIDRAMVGTRLPMLQTAAGRTYLAFSPARERAAILERLAHGIGSDREAMERPAEVDRMIEATRKRGYGVRQREYVPKTSSIAVPVMQERRVLACVNIIWIDSAIEFATAVERYLAPLRVAARKLESELARAKPARPRRKR